MIDSTKQNDPNDHRESAARALSNVLKTLFAVLRLSLVGLVILYLFSGIFTVEPDENAFILRFGAVVDGSAGKRIFESGQWHWSWPHPIDKVIRIPVKKTETVETDQFWHRQSPNTGQPTDVADTWISGKLIPGNVGYLITGDENIIHTRWSLNYTIADPIQYYTVSVNPEDAVRHVFEKAILAEVAVTTINDILYVGAENVRDRVFTRTTALLADLGIGVAIKNITLDAKEPPRSTLPHFRRSTEAEQQKSETLTDAFGYARRTAFEVEGKCSQILAKAEGYRRRIIANAEADKNYFEEIVVEYEKAPETMLLALHSAAINHVLTKAEQKYIIHSNSNKEGQEIRLMLGPDSGKREK